MRVTRIRLFATTKLGGESTGTYSNSAWSLLSNSAVSGEESTSTGLGETGPQGMMERFATPSNGKTASDNYTRATGHCTNPGLSFTHAARWQDGCRISQSTITTFLRRLARVVPGFTVVVLPSPGVFAVMARYSWKNASPSHRMKPRARLESIRGSAGQSGTCAGSTTIMSFASRPVAEMAISNSFMPILFVSRWLFSWQHADPAVTATRDLEKITPLRI